MPSFFEDLKYYIKERPLLTDRQREVVDTLVDQVRSGGFTDYPRASEHVPLIQDGLNDKQVAELWGMAPNTIRQHRQKMSRDLFRVYGKDFFDLLEENNAKSYKIINMRLQYGGSKTSLDVLDPFIVSAIRSAGRSKGYDITDSFDVRNLVSEINFLHSISKVSLETRIDSLDTNGLNHLLDLLDGKTGTVTDRSGIHYKMSQPYRRS